MKELQAMSEVELLQTHSAVITELFRRKVIKTRNPPIGDYTEWLVCSRLGLQDQRNSQAAYDATDNQGIKFQIKGRRSTANSVQFGAIRNLEQHGFDYVIAVIFDNNYAVRLAVKISYDAVRTLARFQAHTNSHILRLTNKVVEQQGVEDIGRRLV